MERGPSGSPFLEINNILTQLKCLQLGKKAAKPLFRQAEYYSYTPSWSLYTKSPGPPTAASGRRWEGIHDTDHQTDHDGQNSEHIANPAGRAIFPRGPSGSRSSPGNRRSSGRGCGRRRPGRPCGGPAPAGPGSEYPRGSSSHIPRAMQTARAP